MDLRQALASTARYFGLAGEPDATSRGSAERDAVAEHLAALERRVADNTAAIEALRAEVMRLSAKL